MKLSVKDKKMFAALASAEGLLEIARREIEIAIPYKVGLAKEEWEELNSKVEGTLNSIEDINNTLVENMSEEYLKEGLKMSYNLLKQAEMTT